MAHFQDALKKTSFFVTEPAPRFWRGVFVPDFSLCNFVADFFLRALAAISEFPYGWTPVLCMRNVAMESASAGFSPWFGMEG
jgi:hypothetical protein